MRNLLLFRASMFSALLFLTYLNEHTAAMFELHFVENFKNLQSKHNNK